MIATRLTQEIEKDERKTIDVGGREIAVGIQPGMIAAMSQLIPIGRAGTPEEAADAVYLFCTPESNYISGQVITVAGGMQL